MKGLRKGRLALMVLLLVGSLMTPFLEAGDLCVIVNAAGEDPLPVLAAREVRRYVYLRTGELLPIVNERPDAGDRVVLERDPSLTGGQHRLRTLAADNGTELTIAAGTEAGLLYGAFRFAHILGVRFALHGDTIPDERIAFSLPDVDVTRTPLFEYRGIQPFHDFPEGPDWWTLDDYRAVLSQMVKLGMNWIGFHCYPEGSVGPEPLVWIGLPGDVEPDGSVRFGYPTRWASTSGGSWGYAATKTSDFAAGASLLFAEDSFGASVTDGFRPRPVGLTACNALFNRTGAFLDEVFSSARALGIRTCIGTETPLRIPEAVKGRLREMGLDPALPETTRCLYEGMFTRIARRHPLDFYWLWTPEQWTWSGVSAEQVERTVADIDSALSALEQVGNPFGFATCGWVLGPPGDRALFDRTLPAGAAVSCINRQVGFTPVEPGFARVEGRGKWAIPWVEDDPAMIVPQLWVGRLRRDAADAHAYGCTGLMGIHWRTKVLAPNFAALAAAAWDQSGWNDGFGKEIIPPEPRTVDVHEGGKTAQTDEPITGSDDDPLYRTCRWNLTAYRLKVPDGVYRVTLRFCEIHYDAAGKRVFGVRLQGKEVVAGLDTFARAGRNKALDLTFDGVAVDGGSLNIDFVPEVEYPFIAAILVEGDRAGAGGAPAEPYVRGINCGGGAHGPYEADLPAAGTIPFPDRPRDLPCEDFYRDWCRAEFGAEIADEMAHLFTSLDGGEGRYGRTKATRLPRPADWIHGPGGIKVNDRPWKEERVRYAFVTKMWRLRERVRGAGNRARFDYWLNTFEMLRTIGRLGCDRGELDRAVAEIGKAGDDKEKKTIAVQHASRLRQGLSLTWERVIRCQLAAADTHGAFGTIANLEMHVRRGGEGAGFLDLHDEALAAAAGTNLPEVIHPGRKHRGWRRLVVPTVRTIVDEGETLTLKVILLDSMPPDMAVLRWRPLGTGEFEEIALTWVARGVYTVTLPPATGAGFEYYLIANEEEDRPLLWPATAPDLNQTVTVAPVPGAKNGTGPGTKSSADPDVKSGVDPDAASFPQSWDGIWKGTCTAKRADGGSFSFAMELHVLPIAGSDRMAWKLVYGTGEKRQVRDYEIVTVDAEKGRFTIDEKNSITIDSVYIDGALHSQYSVGGQLLTVSYTRRDSTILFDLLASTLDEPAESGGGGEIPTVFAYPVGAVQQAVLVLQ